MSQKYVNAAISGEHNETSLPVLEGSMGPPAVDIQTLYTRHGLLAFDPGFRSTASCRSAITFLDGRTGTLRYRGYAVEDHAAVSGPGREPRDRS